MLVEPQIVIGRKIEDGPAGDPGLRSGARLMDAEIRIVDAELLADRLEQTKLVITGQG